MPSVPSTNACVRAAAVSADADPQVPPIVPPCPARRLATTSANPLCVSSVSARPSNRPAGPEAMESDTRNSVIKTRVGTRFTKNTTSCRPDGRMPVLGQFLGKRSLLVLRMASCHAIREGGADHVLRAGVARAPIRRGLVVAGRMPKRSQHRVSGGRMPQRTSGDGAWPAPTGTPPRHRNRQILRKIDP